MLWVRKFLWILIGYFWPNIENFNVKRFLVQSSLMIPQRTGIVIIGLVSIHSVYKGLMTYALNLIQYDVEIFLRQWYSIEDPN